MKSAKALMYENIISWKNNSSEHFPCSHCKFYDSPEFSSNFRPHENWSVGKIVFTLGLPISKKKIVFTFSRFTEKNFNSLTVVFKK